MLEWLQRLDAHLFFLINHQVTHSQLDGFFTGITNLHHQPAFAYGAAPVILLWWAWRQRSYAIKVFIVLGLVAGLCDSFSYRAIKPAVGRLRPHQAYALGAKFHSLKAPPELRVPYGPKSLSFPSNHALSGFALARILTWYHPTAHLWAWLVAGLVAYSRVYVGVHYPSDVVGGALLGLLVASILIRFVFRRFFFLLPFHEGGGYRTRRRHLLK